MTRSFTTPLLSLACALALCAPVAAQQTRPTPLPSAPAASQPADTEPVDYKDDGLGEPFGSAQEVEGGGYVPSVPPRQGAAGAEGGGRMAPSRPSPLGMGYVSLDSKLSESH